MAIDLHQAHAVANGALHREPFEPPRCLNLVAEGRSHGNRQRPRDFTSRTDGGGQDGRFRFDQIDAGDNTKQNSCHGAERTQHAERNPSTRCRFLLASHADDCRLALFELRDAIAYGIGFVRAYRARRRCPQQCELRLTIQALADVRAGGAAFVRVERVVCVPSELLDGEAFGARFERCLQEFTFHRFTAALNFRLALTMYALAPLALVRPSAAVIASSRMSWP